MYAVRGGTYGGNVEEATKSEMVNNNGMAVNGLATMAEMNDVGVTGDGNAL